MQVQPGADREAETGAGGVTLGRTAGVRAAVPFAGRGQEGGGTVPRAGGDGKQGQELRD